MSDQHPQNITDLNQQTKDIWNQNAAFWDSKMGEGNAFQRILVSPSTERLLNLQAAELVLEIGCGNGVFARRLAQLGVHVIATDFSEKFIELAKERTKEHADRIEYQVIDATDEAQLLTLGERRFDAVVCNMAMMDMADIDPLMRSINKLVKSGGRFVFTIMHPCFNTIPGTTRSIEDIDINGELILTYAVKITQYLHTPPQKGLGMIGQPAPHYYFPRPLHVLLNAAFRAGLVMDGIEEPGFNHPHDGSDQSSDHPISWIYYKEIPPVLAVRLRVP